MTPNAKKKAASVLGNPQLVAVFEKLGEKLGITKAPGESVLEALVSTLKAMDAAQVNKGLGPGERRWTQEEINERVAGHYGIPEDTLRTALPTVQAAMFVDAIEQRMDSRAEERAAMLPTMKDSPTLKLDNSPDAVAKRAAANTQGRHADVRAAIKEAKARAEPDRHGAYAHEYAGTRAALREAFDEHNGATRAAPEPDTHRGTRDDVRAALNELKSTEA